MAFNKIAIATLLMTAALSAKADVNYTFNLTDTNGDTIDGTAVYSTVRNNFSSVSFSEVIVGYGTVNLTTPIDKDQLGGLPGNLAATSFSGAPVVWLDGAADSNNFQFGNYVNLAFDNSPGSAHPIFDIANSSNVTSTGFGPQGWGLAASSTFTAAVPEPEEWAMMLLGLPLISWVVRRKQSIVASV